MKVNRSDSDKAMLERLLSPSLFLFLLLFGLLEAVPTIMLDEVTQNIWLQWGHIWGTIRSDQSPELKKKKITRNKRLP